MQLPLLDEAKPVEYIQRIYAKPAGGARCRGDDSELLVVPEGIWRQSTSGRELPIVNVCLADIRRLCTFTSCLTRSDRQPRFNTLHCGRDVSEAAGAARIPDLACAAASGDVLTNPLDCGRPTRCFNLRANRRFRLAEAVAQGLRKCGLEYQSWHD